MNVPKLRFKEFTGEWKEKSFRDIVSLNLVPTEKPSSDYVRLGIRSHCKGTFHELVKIENVLEADKIFLVPKDNLILNITFAWEHAIAITDENDEGKYVSGRFPTFSFKSEELPAFYESIIRSKRMKYELGVASPGGAGRNRVLNKELFLDIPVNTTNIEEQTKISNFIRCVDDKIKNQKAIVESLEKQKKGLMQKIFSQELRFKDDDGKEFPDWEEKKLGEVCDTFSGGTPSVSNKRFYNGDIPFIKSGEIHNDSTEGFISAEGLENSSAKIVEEGDLLYALYGANSGDVAISKIKGAINQAILCIRTNELNKEYLCELLGFSRKNLMNTYLQGGQGNFSAEIFKNLKFLFPKKKEQKKIADFLIVYNEKIDNERKVLVRWQQIKKGLLQQMFV